MSGNLSRLLVLLVLMLIRKSSGQSQLKNFKREVEGETVLTTDEAVPRKINPGPTTLKCLAPATSIVVPRATRVYGVRWTKGEHGNPGQIVFPGTFSGDIATEVATSVYLAYYGAKIATNNEEEINVDIPHCQATFRYYDDYRTKYVDGVAGASLERHNFCHTDTPEGHHSESGHFVIGKFVDSLETVIDLTAFQVPQGITIFVPRGVIHTNNYLLGHWKTMLTLDEPIDEVKMMKNGQPFSFTFRNGAEESIAVESVEAETPLSAPVPDFQSRGGFTVSSATLLSKLVLDGNLAELRRRKTHLTNHALDSVCTVTDPNGRVLSNLTALSLACLCNKTDCAELLLTADAEVNTAAVWRGPDGRQVGTLSPLYWAVTHQNRALVTRLRAKGASTEVGTVSVLDQARLQGLSDMFSD